MKQNRLKTLLSTILNYHLRSEETNKFLHPANRQINEQTDRKTQPIGWTGSNDSRFPENVPNSLGQSLMCVGIFNNSLCIFGLHGAI